MDDHYSSKVAALGREIDDLVRECKQPNYKSNMTTIWIMVISIPIITWLICYYVLKKYFYVDHDIGGEVDTGKIFMYTIIISIIGWIAIYMYSRWSCKVTDQKMSMMMV